MSTQYVEVTDAQIDYKSGIGQDVLFQFRDNQKSHEERILELLAQSNSVVVDEFLSAGSAPGVDPSVYDVSAGSGIGTMMAGSGDHVFRVNGTNLVSVKNLAVKPEKLAFRLNQDMLLRFEARAKDIGTDPPTNILLGFSDNPGFGNDESDCIGFLKGSGANKWRFRVAKGGVSSESGDVGNRATWQTLSLTIVRTGGGGTFEVRGFIDGAQVPNSPFTANLPDTVVLNMVSLIHPPNPGTVDYRLDRWETRWTAIPVNS